MPNDPGDPANDDEQNFSPTEAEKAAADAAETQGVDENDDYLTTDPDPTPFGTEETGLDASLDPTLESDLDEALSDLDTQDEIDEAAADAQADEASAAAEQEGPADAAVDLETQLAERTEDLQRVSAEYANYRRRTEREREATITSAKASVMTQLLPILDDLDLARQHGDLEEGPLKTFGDKLVSTLNGQKLEPFGQEGEDFDPEVHEAVQDLSSGDHKIVGTVLRKGYAVGDRVIRSAMVIIADPDTSGN